MNELRLPWKDNVDEVIDAGKDIVMDGYCSSFQGHIDFIIKAVNNHDALVGALREISRRAYDGSKGHGYSHHELDGIVDLTEDLLNKLK